MWTPLHYACQGGHMNIVQYLITELGCDPVVPNIYGSLPLHIACRHGHLDVTKYLITEQNCNPMCENKDKWTPLHYACQGGRMNIVQYLITELGCDIRASSIYGSLPLHIASRHGHLDVTKNLITEQNCNPMCENKDKWTPLHYACQGGHMNIVQYLIAELGCDPMTRTNFGSLPLHIACGKGHLDLAKYLITEKNCDPTFGNKNMSTPLHYACEGGHMNTVSYLITELGCDPKSMDTYGNLPLHIACRNGHVNLTRHLITEQNCDPNSQGQNGWTPLHFASRGGHMNIVKYLTEVGCEVTATDNNGCLPSHIAFDYGFFSLFNYLNKMLCQVLTSQNKNGWTPLHYASRNGEMDIVLYLISELDCDPRAQNNKGSLPLHIACLYGHVNLAKYFIAELNCDPSQQDQNGWTPLHYASQGGHMEIVQYLITNLGCNPTAQSNIGSLPLHIACFHGHMNLTKYFVTELKCDISIQDYLGRTSLHYANEDGHIDIVSYLMAKHNCNHQSVLTESATEKDETHTKIDSKAIKVCFIGNSAAGKTKLAEGISKKATSISTFSKARNTARVDLRQVESQEIGTITLCDLPGDTEYHRTSHSVVMETVIQQSPAIFVIVIDLNNADTEITQQFCYWIDYTNSFTSKMTGESSLIIVGSHADLLSEEELKERTLLVNNIVQERAIRQKYMGFVSLDCRNMGSENAQKLTSLLIHSQQAIAGSAQPSMSSYCHLLFECLKKKQENTAFNFENLTTILAEKHLATDIPILNDLLLSLNDDEIVTFLQHAQQSDVDNEAFLKVVLFPQKEFQEHHKFSGIVHSSSLKHLLPMYDLEMLVDFLENLELCHRVTDSRNKHITHYDPEDFLVFFPSLLKNCRPSKIFSTGEKLSFGWCMCCRDEEYLFFTSRFIHVLLLRLYVTYLLPLVSVNNDLSCDCERSCIVWVNGVSWKSAEGIRTIVELVGEDQCVVITVFNRSEISPLEEYNVNEHYIELIKLVQDLKQQICLHMKTQEYCINCDLVDCCKTNETMAIPPGFLLEIETDQYAVQVKKQHTVVDWKTVAIDENNGKDSPKTALSSTAVDTYYTPNHGEV